MDKKRSKAILEDLVRVLRRYDIHTATTAFVDSDGSLMSCKMSHGKAEMRKTGEVKDVKPIIIQSPGGGG